MTSVRRVFTMCLCVFFFLCGRGNEKVFLKLGFLLIKGTPHTAFAMSLL